MTIASTPAPSVRPTAGSLERAAAASAAEIEVHEVSKSYGSAKFAKTVIRDCSFTIRIGGKSVTEPGRDRLVLFQETALFPWMTTYDNIMFGPRARAEGGSEPRRRAQFLLDKVGLAAFRRKYPTQLSGGMQRR